MDLSVTVETKNMRVDARHQSIFDLFCERNLFPLVKIVRFISDDDEIIDVYTVTAEKRRDGGYDLKARQVEIIKETEFDRRRLLTASMN